MSRIPTGVDPNEWLIQKLKEEHIPQTISRLIVAVVVAAVVRTRIVRIVMVVAAAADAGLLVWMYRRVRQMTSR